MPKKKLTIPVPTHCTKCGAPVRKPGQRITDRVLSGLCATCAISAHGKAKHAAKLATRGPVPMKHCGECGVELPKRNRTGLCIPCYKLQWGRENYAENSEALNEYQRNLRAQDPEKWLAYSREYEAKHHDNRLAQHQEHYPEYREGRRVYSRAYRKAHPEAKRADSKRRKALKKGAGISDFTDEQFEALKKHFNYRCAFCPADCTACKAKTHVLTRDHLTPVTKGGPDTVQNIVPACGPCNSRKGNRGVPCPVQPVLFI